MAKKYLSLEEAAELAGMPADEIKRLREEGELRGFADRGTWKFKHDDIEELARSRTADSDPSVPLLNLGAEDDEPPTDELVLSADEAGDESPTVIRGGSALDEDLASSSSDSDVRLVLDDSLTTEDSAEDDLMVTMGDSDSDVRLADSSPGLGRRSDSAVRIEEPGLDSDIKLVSGTADDSDSDVKLVGEDSDSDVKLVADDSDSDVKLVGEDSDSDVKLIDEEPATEFDSQMVPMDDATDSDIRLVEASDSGTTDAGGTVFDDDDSSVSLNEGSSITLSAESGISLETISGSGVDLDDEADSDIALELVNSANADDSDLELNDDSGITLEGFDDSGIALVDEDDALLTLDDESGIEVDSPADSGIALESIDSGVALAPSGQGATVPMLETPDFDDDLDDTAMEIPSMSGDSEYELSMDGDDDESDANVIMFDDDDGVDEHGATAISRDVSEEFDLTGDDSFDLEDSAEFGDPDEFSDADFDAGDEFDDMVAGDDDDLDDLDVFDEGDDFDDDEVFAGESQGDFDPDMPLGMVAAPPQAEWGAGAFVGLIFSTGLLGVCGLMMFDLVKSMWMWQEPGGFSSSLLSMFKGLAG